MPTLPKKRRRKGGKKPPPSDHRREMLKAYGEFYRIRLKQEGVPTRRQMAEAALEAIVVAACGPTPEAARQLLAAMAKKLRKARLDNGQRAFEPSGILYRWEQLVAELVHRKRSPRALPPAVRNL
jgi:hypothetical protein